MALWPGAGYTLLIPLLMGAVGSGGNAAVIRRLLHFLLFHSFAGVVLEGVDYDASASVRWKSIQFQEVGEDFTRSSGASANVGLRWKLDFNAGNVFFGVFGVVFVVGSVTW